MSFQVYQVVGHVESDLESPGVSYGRKIFWSVGLVCISYSLCLLVVCMFVIVAWGGGGGEG